MSIGRFLVGTVVAVTVLVPAGGEGDEPASASATAHRQTATFAMYCYWTGEATLGRVDGVLASRIGHWGGREIVQVDFDPRRTDVAALVRALARQRSFDAVVVGETAGGEPPLGAIDPKHVVRHSGSPRFIEPKHSLRTQVADVVGGAGGAIGRAGLAHELAPPGAARSMRIWSACSRRSAMTAPRTR